MALSQIKQENIKKILEDESGSDYVAETDRDNCEYQHSKESSSSDELPRFCEDPENKVNTTESGVVSMQKESIDLFESNGESSSDDNVTPFKKGAKPSRPRSKKTAMNSWWPSPNRELSEFEKQRERNIQERMRLMKELGIGNIIKELEDINRPVKKQKPKETKPKLPPRKSETLKTLNKNVAPAIAPITDVSRRLKPFLAMSACLYRQQDRFKLDEIGIFGELLNDMNSKQKLTYLEHFDLDKFETESCKLSTNELQCLKIFPSEISSIDFNPLNSSLIMTAGSSTGSVAIWKYNSMVRNERSSIVFVPHHSYVSCVSFSRFNSSILYSTSHDGTCHKGDLTASHFELAYASSSQSKVALNWLAELSSSVIMIALQTGQVSCIDTRESTDKCKLYSLHSSPVVTVSVNNNTHLLATATEDEVISLFDIRNLLSSKPVSTIKLDGSIPSSAFLSHSGDRLLTTKGANHISIYENLNLENPVMCWNARRYTLPLPIYKQKLAVPYKAMWHPLRDDFFSVGSLDSGVDLYKSKINEKSDLNQYAPSNLRSLSHFNLATFHPSFPAMVAAGGDTLCLYN